MPVRFPNGDVQQASGTQEEVNIDLAAPVNQWMKDEGGPKEITGWYGRETHQN